MSSVKVVVGTMSVGSSLDDDKTSQVLSLLERKDVKELDTALMYVGGESEKVLGRLGAAAKFFVATKANPWFAGTVKQ